MTRLLKHSVIATLLVSLSCLPGCAHLSGQASCDTCEMGLECDSCDTGGSAGWNASWMMWRARMFGARRSHAIPEQLPLGVIVRSHYQAMETNAEAVDFILYDHDFVLNTAELTSDGKDKLLEIAARMRSAPFPVIVERSENNSDPELDSYRRNLIAQILTDLGNPDGDQRTIVSTPYGPGYNSIEAERNWTQFVGGGQGGNFGNFGGGIGGALGGGLGGGGFGGGGGFF